MQTIIETVQPYVSTIATAVVGVLTTVILAGLNTVKVKANTWLEARTTAAQREVIHKIAGEGFAFAQTAFKQADGERKLQEALQYATLRLAEQGITVSVVELQATIEKAYLEYKARTKAVLATEAQPNEEAAQAAAKEAVSSLAAQVTAILSQATGADTVASVAPETLQDTAPAPQANVTGVTVE
ncbi:phage holin, LLH family [Paenibacillus maysiensis]|uniref:phage holin, LLH family n=1 Tax=Paenibacillus maysiensis TaxID=1155954 RepID=UPI0004700EA5|nr:phage holin, LLH family [Paenibacillus maysiensis]